MKVGIDGRSLKTSRAIFRYTKNLLNSLAAINKENEYLLFVEGRQELQRLSFLNLSLNWKLVKAPRKIVLRDHFFFRDFIKEHRLDLFFHPDNSEFLFCHPKSVVTIHDAIPYLLPNLSLSANPLWNLKQKLYLQLQKKAVFKAAAVITVSQNSKKDIAEVFAVSPERIAVIPEANEPSFARASQTSITAVKERFKINSDYILSHTGFRPYKNLGLLLGAFAKACQTDPGISLVLSGSYSDGSDRSYYRELQKLARDLGIAERVIFTGFVAEEFLPALYSGALIFVYPSLYEGFGLPLLEAQSCQVPVVSSQAAALPEVAGEAAVFFDPTDLDDLVSKLNLVLADASLRQSLVNRGLLNLKRFSWDKAAGQTLELFEKVLRQN